MTLFLFETRIMSPETTLGSLSIRLAIDGAPLLLPYVESKRSSFCRRQSAGCELTKIPRKMLLFLSRGSFFLFAATFAAALIAYCIIQYPRGIDINWDLRNYHLASW